MTKHRPHLTWLIAALLFVAAAALRVPGHGHGLPHRSEPDTYVVEQAEGLERRGLLDRADAAWKYPLLVATLVAAVPAAAPAAAPATLEEHLAEASRPHRHARFVIALLSALIAPATFLLARPFLHRSWAALAGLLASASLLHLCFSLQARPHAPASVATILAIVACLRFVRLPGTGSAALVGLGTGLAVATLHTGFLTLAPCAVALVLGARARGARVIGPALLALALVVAAAAWAYVPGERVRAARARGAPAPAFVDPTAAGGGVDPGPALRFSGHVVPLSTFDGSGFGAIAGALAAYDPFALAAAAVGLAAAAMAARRRPGGRSEPREDPQGSADPGTRPRRAAALVVAGYFVPALLVYGVFARTEARLVLAFVPLVATLAAGGVAAVARRVGPRWRPAVVAATLTVTVAPAVRLAWLRARPDTVERAAAWVSTQNAAHTGGDDGAPTAAGPAPEALCLNLLSLPLFQAPGAAHPDGAWSRSRWERYQAALAARERDVGGGSTAQRLGVQLRYPSSADIAALWLAEDPPATARGLLAREAPDLVVLGTSLPATIVPAGTRRALEGFRAAVAASDLELVATLVSSAPGAADADVGFQTTLAVVLRARAFGPRIELWRRAEPPVDVKR